MKRILSIFAMIAVITIAIACSAKKSVHSCPAYGNRSYYERLPY